MPSTQPLPTVTQFRKASQDALRGQFDKYADNHDGSMYDQIAGPYAVLMARESANDRDLFRAIYFDDALDGDLTQRGVSQYNIPRILDTYGQGTLQINRPNSSAGNGQILQGSRIQVAGTVPVVYQVSSDTNVSGTSASLPIRATVVGPGSAANVTGGLSFLDPVYDTSWKPTALTCADGTSFEKAADYRARVRQTLLANRNGYAPPADLSTNTAMLAALQQSGAFYAVFFGSSYGLSQTDFNDDFGLNAIYVADKNYASSAALIQACAVALESTRVLGADLWVGGIAQQVLPVTGTVTLNDSPGSLELVPIQRSVVQAILTYFSGTGSGYVYKRSALAGAMQKAHPSVQSVSFTAPVADATLPNLTSTVANPVVGGLVQGWPATLTRYVAQPSQINLTFTGPV